MTSTQETTPTHNTHQILQKLMAEQQWEELEAFVQQHPHVAHDTFDESYGWTLLHGVTSTANTPIELIRTVAAANPQAILTPDSRYRDLPVHFVCRNLQTSAAKLLALLDYCTSSTDLLLHRNEFGGTPLHSACNHNAVLPALQALVHATHSQILRVRTFQGHHCVTTLWQSYSSTIQGHLCVANLLLSDTTTVQIAAEVLPRHFQLFWEKCQYLSLASYSSSASQNDLLHALLRCNVPIHLFKVAARLVNDEAFSTPDNTEGHLPLHWVLENRPYPQLQELAAIQKLLDRGAVAASMRTPSSHELPLLIAIRHKIPWRKGMCALVEAYPSAIHSQAAEGWFPFQLAALVGGKPLPSLETIFQLIRTQPDLLFTCTQTS